MSHEPLAHHEIDVARLGRVRLPRVRAVVSATTAVVLIGGKGASENVAFVATQNHERSGALFVGG